ncbi:TPA: glycosyltransferase family 2 protein [Vibrio vulnificus]
MLISLVLCTVGRTEEVDDFIDSIISTQRNVELIIVDQNKDDRIAIILERVSFPVNIIVKHIRPDILGLSRARNIGLKHVTGDVFAFPDDDCIYSKHVLDYVEDNFFTSDFDFFSCRTHQKNSPLSSLIKCQKEYFEIAMDRRAGCSFTLFFKNNEKTKDISFDEAMGVGSGTYYGSGEETDYITQMLYLKCKGYYEPSVVVYHDAKEESYNKTTLARLVSYGGGYSYHIRKNHMKLGRVYSLKLLFAIPLRILRSLNNKEEFMKALNFAKGTLNGLFK